MTSLEILESKVRVLNVYVVGLDCLKGNAQWKVRVSGGVEHYQMSDCSLPFFVAWSTVTEPDTLVIVSVGSLN